MTDQLNKEELGRLEAARIVQHNSTWARFYVQLAERLVPSCIQAEPRKRTVEELERAIIDYYGDSYDVPEVVEELIALAKEAKP